MAEETVRQTRLRRARDTLRAAFVCLLVSLLCITAQQFSTQANLLPPQQTEQESTSEEIQEGKVKAHELVSASRRKALHQSQLRISLATKRAVFLRLQERRSAIALCWSADTYRRRGPPGSVPLS